MRGIVITADNQISAQDFGDPLHLSLGRAVGGYIEHVKPRGLKAPYCMIINEEGLLMDLPVNCAASILYETPKHGCPIVGTVVIMKDGYRSGEPDIVGLEPDEEAELLRRITSLLRNTSWR